MKSNSRIILSLVFQFLMFSLFAQEILQLKVQMINKNGTLVNKNLVYEIVDNSSLFFLKDGKRQKGSMDLKLQELEVLETGAEITSYAIQNEEISLDQIGIVDMRHLNSAERIATTKFDVPILLMLVDEEDKANIQFMKAEIIQGEIAKDNSSSRQEEAPSSNSKVVFSMLQDKNLSMELDGDRLNWLDEGAVFAHLDLEFEKEVKLQKAIYHYYLAKGLGYTNLTIVDLRNVEIADRQSEFSSDSPILLVLKKGANAASKQFEAQIISGDLTTGKKSKIPAVKKEIKIKTIAEIHLEVTDKLKDLSEGFYDQVSQEPAGKSDGSSLFAVKQELGGYTSGMISFRPNGAYKISMNLADEHAEKDVSQMIEALSSYQGGAFSLMNIERADDSFCYVVSEGTKEIGFLEFRNHKGRWAVTVVDMIDADVLKADIIENLNLLETQPAALKGEKTGEQDEKKIYLASSSCYGSYKAQFLESEGQSSFVSSYLNYPMSGLHYIVKNLNINLPGRKMSIVVDGKDDDSGEEGLLMAFEKHENYMSIGVGRFDNSFTILELGLTNYK